MSLAARWISSPLPYQLGLALQIAAFNVGMHCWPLHSRVQPGKPLNIGSFPYFSGVILTALRASVNMSFIARCSSLASSPWRRNSSAADQNSCIRAALPMQQFIVSIPRAIAQDLQLCVRRKNAFLIVRRRWQTCISPHTASSHRM
jgi:hypothetical protein